MRFCRSDWGLAWLLAQCLDADDFDRSLLWIMSQGEGCWLVVLLLPRLQHRVVGCYRIRSDAEVHAYKLRRILGDRYSVRVVFDN